MELDGKRQAPVALLPGRRIGTRYVGRWVGPMAGLHDCGKPRPNWHSVQFVASRYTDYSPPKLSGQKREM
jgi:hypothetical protein